MEWRSLRYFLAIVDAGSATAAAQRVHVAQPSLSRQIRGLEKDLGLVLFDRSAKSLSLSAAGRAFLPVARDLVNRATQAQATANTMSKGTISRLTVASAPTTVADIISPYIVQAGPAGLIVNVVEASPEHVYDAIARGDADFAVGTRVPPAEMNSKVIGHAYLWAQFPPDHSLVGRDRVDIADLVAQPLIVMTQDHRVRRMFDAAVSREGLSYTPAFETESPYVAQALAAAGRGVCILSDDSRYDLEVASIGLAGGELIITLFGVWDPVHYAATRIVECVDDLSGFVSKLYPQNR
jgi:DNA-binding transcriptional LysR family regulator